MKTPAVNNYLPLSYLLLPFSISALEGLSSGSKILYAWLNSVYQYRQKSKSRTKSSINVLDRSRNHVTLVGISLRTIINSIPISRRTALRYMHALEAQNLVVRECCFSQDDGEPRLYVLPLDVVTKRMKAETENFQKYENYENLAPILRHSIKIEIDLLAKHSDNGKLNSDSLLLTAARSSCKKMLPSISDKQLSVLTGIPIEVVLRYSAENRENTSKGGVSCRA